MVDTKKVPRFEFVSETITKSMGPREQETFFKAIGNILKEKTECFVIGGSAMLYYGTKTVTKEVDVVFTNEKARNSFVNAAFKLGYKERSSFILYPKKKNVPILLEFGDSRLDVFLKKVVCFELSDAIISRIEKVIEYGNLIIKIVSPVDIIFLKCATERAGDRADAKEIIEKTSVDWQILIDEAKRQTTKEMIVAAFLYSFLAELKEDLGVNVPEKVLTELVDITEREAAARGKN